MKSPCYNKYIELGDELSELSIIMVKDGPAAIYHKVKEVLLMYIADLHIHSRYSRATSKDCTPEYLELWARRKGIHIVGTGDFTHPAWREELKEKLTPDGNGFYRLKEKYRIKDDTAADSLSPRFVITGEISSIYKKAGKVRKVHNLIILPGLEAAELIAKKLETIGNIHSDGRPILGLDCHDLLEITLELCPEAIFVPAHIWTPHFSLFGAFSGFDTMEECFGDLSSHIHAVETGLSSDPPMNWRVSALDNYQLISNSDAHSPAKLGREANLLDVELTYRGLENAIQKGAGLHGTIEFFPEEGKYHFDGHRKCNLCLNPVDTEKYNGICPVCGRKITIGVSHRVEQLADRAQGYRKENVKVFESLVPLPEVIGASVGHSPASVRVQREYMNMLRRLGPEFDILRTLPLEDIRATSGYLISEGIGRLREGKVERIPGFDGEYGTIQLFTPSEIENTSGQMSFLDMLGGAGKEMTVRKDGSVMPAAAIQPGESLPKEERGSSIEKSAKIATLNEQQERAVKAASGHIAVIAGPGTGKTKTLVSRIVYMLENRKVKPAEITAVTFTNQAAGEMRERIQGALSRKRQLNSMQIGTFHSICLSFLQQQGVHVSIADDMETKELARSIVKEFKLKITAGKFLELVSRKKSGIEQPDSNEIMDEAFDKYENFLRQRNLMDFDDLLLQTLIIIEGEKAEKPWRKRFSYLLVDEFQDINPLQYRLVKAWNKTGRELFTIGDPDQSIYGFRGADAACFDRIKEDFKELEVIKLVDNYRSTPQILQAALNVISKNPGAERKLNPNVAGDIMVRLAKAETNMEEAVFIAKEINRLAGGIGMLEAHQASDGAERKIRSFDEIAVLYRTHHQAALLEKCLKKEGIPYMVAGRELFLDEEAVKGTIYFFRYVDNPEDQNAREQGLKFLLNLESNLISEEIFENMAGSYRPLYMKKKPQKLLEMWMKEMKLEENEAMQKFAGMTIFYKSMNEFLEVLSLGVESDLKRCGDKYYSSGAVTLMTLHGSKGLEFPAVIICGAQRGLIPFKSEKHPADKEEERRLLYVGMTRAKEELILTCAGGESEFLECLPKGLLKKEKVRMLKQREEFHQMDLFEF